MRAVWVVESKPKGCRTWLPEEAYNRRSRAAGAMVRIHAALNGGDLRGTELRVVKYVPAKPKQRAADAAKERR